MWEQEEWFIFGYSEDGLYCDVADSYSSTVISDLPVHIAQYICDAHNASIERLRLKVKRMLGAIT